ncbi:MAG: AraC family transcriptional regulator [Burkholderiales bacterium]|nr:AraC family transcriptional regulator [Burkholderiales bacterium]
MGATRPAPDVREQVSAITGIVPDRVIGQPGFDRVHGAVWTHAPVTATLDCPPHHTLVWQMSGTQDVTRIDAGRITGRGTRVDRVSLMEAGCRSTWCIGGVARVLHLYIPVALLQQHAAEHGLPGGCALQPFFSIDDPWLRHFSRLVLEDARDLDSRTPCPLLLDAAAACLASHLLRHHGADATGRRARSGPTAETGGLRPAALRRVQAYIDAHLGDTLRLDTLASLANVSRHHFVRAFRTSVGVTPHRYLLAQRLLAARTLLTADTQRPLGEIARAVGFTSASHFSATFSRHEGVAPSQLRRRVTRSAPIRAAAERRAAPPDRGA